LLADRKDHGPGEHDYPLWQKRWTALLGGKQTAEPAPSPVSPAGLTSSLARASLADAGIAVIPAWAWPSQPQFQAADVIVANCYLKWTPERLTEVRSYLARGGGIVLIHPASWTVPDPSEQVAALFGVGGYTQFRHGPVKVQIRDPRHPICIGFPASFDLLDETYWPPTPFRAGQVEVLASSEEKAAPDSAEAEPQPLFWTYQSGRGRVFGCVPGHYVWTFEDPLFRLLLLRGLAWAAAEPVCRFDALAKVRLD
jgi:type 1 glutamine amidotransferase